MSCDVRLTHLLLPNLYHAAALVALGASHADEQGLKTFKFDEGPMGW